MYNFICVTWETFNKIHYVKDERDRQALMKDWALYTLISRLKFDDKERYEIDIFFNDNLISHNAEVKKIMDFYL